MNLEKLKKQLAIISLAGISSFSLVGCSKENNNEALSSIESNYRNVWRRPIDVGLYKVDFDQMLASHLSIPENILNDEDVACTTGNIKYEYGFDNIGYNIFANNAKYNEHIITLGRIQDNEYDTSINTTIEYNENLLSFKHVNKTDSEKDYQINTVNYYLENNEVVRKEYSKSYFKDDKQSGYRYEYNNKDNSEYLHIMAQDISISIDTTIDKCIILNNNIVDISNEEYKEIKSLMIQYIKSNRIEDFPVELSSYIESYLNKVEDQSAIDEYKKALSKVKINYTVKRNQ